MSEAFSYLLVAYGAFVLAAASPGPNVLAIMEIAFRKGRRESIALALGVATGSLFWGICTVVGLTVLLLGMPFLTKLLQVIGACYLYWLAYKSFRAMRGQNIKARSIPLHTRLIRYYGQGLLIQVTNAKAAVSWLIIYSVALTETPTIILGFYVIAGTGLLSVLIYVSYGLFFSIQNIRDFYLRNQSRLQCVIGIMFCLLATLLLVAKVSI